MCANAAANVRFDIGWMTTMIDWLGVFVGAVVGAFIGFLVKLYFDEKRDRP